MSASDDICTVLRTMSAHHLLEAASEALLVLNTDDRVIVASRTTTGFVLVRPDDDGPPRLLVDSVFDSALSGLDSAVRLRDPYGPCQRC